MKELSMGLPWGNDKKKRIEELEDKVEELEEEKEKYKNRFEAEEERRSKLSNEKQKAEKKLKVLEQRLTTLKEKQQKDEEEEEKVKAKDLDFDEAYRLLKKMESVESPEDDLITIYSPGKLSNIDDLKGLKNAVSKKQLRDLQRHESFIGLVDQDVFHNVLRVRPFFNDNWEIESEFNIEPVMEFIETEKTWVLVSAGETEIYEERAGEVEHIDTLKSRIDRDHSKGGFSQGRFERKREEQIQEHLNHVENELEGRTGVYLLGERKLCKKLSGDYLGGFDPNRQVKQELYKFRLVE